MKKIPIHIKKGLKIFMKKKLKLIITLIVLLSLYIFVSAYFYVSQVSNDLQKNVLRLHVIANSDSLEDQNLKYIVRDNLIKYMNSLCSNVSSKEEALDTVSIQLKKMVFHTMQVLN